MRFDFSAMTNRRNTNSLKWDVGESELPMWVADMDFQTAPVVIDAVRRKAEGGIFGYGIVPDAFTDAVAGWWKQRHGFAMEKDWIIFCTGVVPAISSIVRKMTTPGEKVLIQPPVYNIFYNSIVNNGRFIETNNLVYKNGAYAMDFADLEQRLSDPQVSLMILCNPHNPTGNIWDRDTLERVGALCRKHHVLVVSDEIHCDLTDPGYHYTPFASVSEDCEQNSITCIAPTKAFNLAGMQTASVVVPNGLIRHRVWRGLNTDEIAEPNAFAIEAAMAAYTQGGPWLDALREYLLENKNRVREFVAAQLPGITVVPSHATYLLWLDCAGITDHTTELCERIRRETGLILTEGEEYGKNGTQFLRLNTACPRERLEDGLQRLKKAVVG